MHRVINLRWSGGGRGRLSFRYDGTLSICFRFPSPRIRFPWKGEEDPSRLEVNDGGSERSGGQRGNYTSENNGTGSFFSAIYREKCLQREKARQASPPDAYSAVARTRVRAIPSGNFQWTSITRNRIIAVETMPASRPIRFIKSFSTRRRSENTKRFLHRFGKFLDTWIPH